MCYNNSLNGIKFAKDTNGKWGYYEAGADSVTPFKSGNVFESYKSPNTYIGNNTQKLMHTFEKNGYAFVAATIANSGGLGIYSAILYSGRHSCSSAQDVNITPRYIYTYGEVKAGDKVYLRSQGQNNDSRNYGTVSIVFSTDKIF